MPWSSLPRIECPDIRCLDLLDTRSCGIPTRSLGLAARTGSFRTVLEPGAAPPQLKTTNNLSL
eukprot:9492314-Pyramimonas_sp.AAC.1